MEVFTEITPSTPEDFQLHIQNIMAYNNCVHINVADNVYVPYATTATQSLQIPPSGTFEAHLLVYNPMDYWSVCKEKGIKRVYSHLETLSDTSDNGVLLMKEYVQQMGVEFCIAYKPGVPVDLFPETLSQLDGVLVLTYDPAHSERVFIPQSLDTVRTIRKLSAGVSISVEGVTSVEMGEHAVEAGATRLVMSSAVMNQGDLFQQLSQLR